MCLKCQTVRGVARNFSPPPGRFSPLPENNSATPLIEILKTPLKMHYEMELIKAGINCIFVEPAVKCPRRTVSNLNFRTIEI